jgi:hypothetical protein
MGRMSFLSLLGAGVGEQDESMLWEEGTMRRGGANPDRTFLSGVAPSDMESGGARFRSFCRVGGSCPGSTGKS